MARKYIFTLECSVEFNTTGSMSSDTAKIEKSFEEIEDGPAFYKCKTKIMKVDRIDEI